MRPREGLLCWCDRSLCYDADEDEGKVESLLICSSRVESSGVAVDKGEKGEIIKGSTTTMVPSEFESITQISNLFSVETLPSNLISCHVTSPHLTSTSSPYIVLFLSEVGSVYFIAIIESVR